MRIEIFGCDALHVFHRHLRDLRKAFVGKIRITARNQGFAQLKRPTARGFTAAQSARYDFTLGFCQLGGGDRLGANALDFRIQCLTGLLHAFRVADNRIDRNLPRLAEHRNIARGIHRLPRANERCVEPTAVPAREDRFQNFKRGSIWIVDCRAFPDPADYRQRHVGGRGIHRSRPCALRFALHNCQFDRIGARRDVGEILIHQRLQARHLEIARHNQCRGIRAVIGFVKSARIIERRAVEVFDAANARAAMRHHIIGVFGENKPLQPAIRRREHALAQLLLHHTALGLEHFIVDHDFRHPLTVGPKHRFEISGWHLLEIIGAVDPVGCVARAADIGSQAVNHIVRHVLGLAAENVLEQVGETAAAFGVEFGTDVVPQRSGDRAGGIVFNRNDAQTVFECPHRVIDFGRAEFGRICTCMVIGQRRASGNKSHGRRTSQHRVLQHVIIPVF